MKERIFNEYIDNAVKFVERKKDYPLMDTEEREKDVLFIAMGTLFDDLNERITKLEKLTQKP